LTTPELNWPVIDVDGGLDTEVPDAVGTSDLVAALAWAHDAVAPMDPTIDVHVLFLTDLRTTQDTGELHEAADELLHKATVHLILLDPSYVTLSLASTIAPGRVLLAASPSGLHASLSQLLPGPTVLPFALAPPPLADQPLFVASMPDIPMPDPAVTFAPPTSYEPAKDSLVSRAMEAIGRRVRKGHNDGAGEPAAIADSPAVHP
jgi:hypothetical protein